MTVIPFWEGIVVVMIGVVLMLSGYAYGRLSK